MDQNGPYVSICLLVNSLDPLISTGEFWIFQVAWSVFVINIYINIYFCLLRTGVYSWEQQLILHVWPRFPTFPPRRQGRHAPLPPAGPAVGDLRPATLRGARLDGLRSLRSPGEGQGAWQRRHGMEPEDVRMSLGCPNPPWIHIDLYDLYTVPMCFLQPIQDILIYSSGPPFDKAGIWGWGRATGLVTGDVSQVIKPRGPWRKDAIVNDKSDGCWTLFDMYWYVIYVYVCPRLVGRCYVGYRQVDPHNDVHLDFILWFLELMNIMCQTR